MSSVGVAFKQDVDVWNWDSYGFDFLTVLYMNDGSVIWQKREFDETV